MSVIAEVMQLHLDKSYKTGEAIDLIIGIPKNLSIEELSQVQASLLSQGVRVLEPIEIGSEDTEKWQNAVRMKVSYNPIPKGEVGFLPLAVLIIAALGAVGVTGIIGWKIGGVFDAVKKNFVPVFLIGIGGIVLLALILRPAIPESIRAARGG